MKKVGNILKATVLVSMLCALSNAPASAGIIGSDSMNTSQVAGSTLDVGVWSKAYTFSPRLASVLIQLGLI